MYRGNRTTTNPERLEMNPRYIFIFVLNYFITIFNGQTSRATIEGADAPAKWMRDSHAVSTRTQECESVAPSAWPLVQRRAVPQLGRPVEATVSQRAPRALGTRAQGPIGSPGISRGQKEPGQKGGRANEPIKTTNNSSQLRK